MRLSSLFPAPVPAPDANVYDFCVSRPERHGLGDVLLYIDGLTGDKLSYRDFRRRVAHGATALSAPVSEGGLELKKEDGEVVGILSENCVDYLTLAHSLFALTIPVAFLSSYSTRYELVDLLRQAKITRLFVHPRLLDLARRVGKEVGLPEQNVYILGGHVKGRKAFSDMITKASAKDLPFAARPTTKNTLAYLMFSSGTSGRPKAVMISHGNIFATVQQNEIHAVVGAAAAPPQAGVEAAVPVGLAVLPLHHTYGLGNTCFRPFASPVTMVILPRWDPIHVLDAIEKYRINRLSLVPSVLESLVNAQRNRKADTSSLSLVGSGAAYLSPEGNKRLQSMAPNAINMQGYGLSECTMTATIQSIKGALEGRYHPAEGSIGILVPGMKAKILRVDGSDAEVNEPGELFLRGEGIAMGYLHNELATRETFLPRGWLRTGDRVRADEHGNLFFEDRAKDTLKISGMQVSPTEIEDTLLAHPAGLLTDVSVAGVSGGRSADERVPRAWVVLSAAGAARGRDAVVRALDVWVKERLSKYKWLRGGIEVVDEIPKSPTGKVLRRVLQEKYEQDKAKGKARL